MRQYADLTGKAWLSAEVCQEQVGINENFRVLKDSEIRQYGEYSTKCLVLEA